MVVNVSYWTRVDDRFQRQMENWKRLILKWHALPYHQVTLYVPYERLVDSRTGPAVAAQLDKELGLNTKY
jgi:hypothetical protein